MNKEKQTIIGCLENFLIMLKGNDVQTTINGIEGLIYNLGKESSDHAPIPIELPAVEEIRFSILGHGNPYPLECVLERLKWATNYLLHEKNYDGHCYEELEQCVRRVDEIKKHIHDYCLLTKPSEKAFSNFLSSQPPWPPEPIGTTYSTNKIDGKPICGQNSENQEESLKIAELIDVFKEYIKESRDHIRVHSKAAFVQLKAERIISKYDHK